MLKIRRGLAMLAGAREGRGGARRTCCCDCVRPCPACADQLPASVNFGGITAGCGMLEAVSPDILMQRRYVDFHLLDASPLNFTYAIPEWTQIGTCTRACTFGVDLPIALQARAYMTDNPWGLPQCSPHGSWDTVAPYIGLPHGEEVYVSDPVHLTVTLACNYTTWPPDPTTVPGNRGNLKNRYYVAGVSLATSWSHVPFVAAGALDQTPGSQGWWTFGASLFAATLFGRGFAGGNLITAGVAYGGSAVVTW